MAFEAIMPELMCNAETLRRRSPVRLQCFQQFYSSYRRSFELGVRRWPSTSAISRGGLRNTSPEPKGPEI